MKRIKRNPEKFDVVDLLAAISRKKGLQLNDEATDKIFIESIKESLVSNKSPILLHGKRVESMFGYVAASLGKCKLVKNEDSGDGFVKDAEAIIPDYRVITTDDKQFLVEVKNYHVDNPLAKYSLKETYLNSLKSYASLVNLELMIAIYWSRWNIWVLISPDAFQKKGTSYVITFTDSIKHNQMSVLGDIIIGTTSPMVFRLISDSDTKQDIEDDGEFIFTIKSYEFLCGGQKLTQKEEQDIALYLMMYGEWPSKDSITYTEDDGHMAIEFTSEPIEKTKGQNFELLGYLSGMISRQYNYLTAPSGQVERFAPNVDPEMLGINIPENYKGVHLPLWRLVVNPANDEKES